MSQRSISVAWLFTILALTILAGLSWVDLTLSPASGGQEIEVTGFLVFPIISALLLLQGSALLAAFFTPALVGRIIAGLQIPIVLWHAFAVLSTVGSALQDAVAAEITKATGVVGVASQAQLVDTALDNNIWYIYLAVLALNAVALVSRALVGKVAVRKATRDGSGDDSEDLWESQR
jgi:hypothetical protein